jgi:hypothetical protein
MLFQLNQIGKQIARRVDKHDGEISCSHLLPGGRKPLRQFSGNAQEDNTGGFTGCPFGSRSTHIAGKS